MTSKERILKFIAEYVAEHIYAPSIREICEGTGLKSTSTVYQHLINLELDGELKFEGVRRITLKGYKVCKDDTEKLKS